MGLSLDGLPSIFLPASCRFFVLYPYALLKNKTFFLFFFHPRRIMITESPLYAPYELVNPVSLHVPCLCVIIPKHTEGAIECHVCWISSSSPHSFCFLVSGFLSVFVFHFISAHLLFILCVAHPDVKLCITFKMFPLVFL